MSKKKIKARSYGFEVLKTEEGAVVYKRIVSPTGRSNKDQELISLSLPKVTMICFSVKDYQRLKELENELRQEMLSNEPRMSFFSKFLQYLH